MGEKIKRINEYLKSDSDNSICDDDFKPFEFDDYELAKFIDQEDDNRLLYEHETALQIVDTQFLSSKPFFIALFI